MEPHECRALLEDARSAVLASVGTRGPHVVPIVFAVVGEDRIVSAVDHKPKTTRHLRRLDNIRRDARVAVLAERYDEDWTKLWWVKAVGVATVEDEAEAIAEAAAALTTKYEQYAGHPPLGPVIDIRVGRWTGWRASR
jgi:PPOX class probable F420-dependent enzyme